MTLAAAAVNPNELIEVRRVCVSKDRRPVNRATVLALAASMAERTLLQPIGVTPALELLWGAHRLAAARELGWKVIAARVCDVQPGSPEAELLEIDENLIREDLSVLDRARETARRKAAYERLHPETRRPKGGRRGNAATVAAFVDETASKTGRSARSVRRDAQIGAGLAPDVADALRGSPLEEHTRTLLALATLPPESQAAAVKQGETAILRAASGIRQKRADKRREARIDYYREQAAPASKAQLGRYAVIYADPPWSFDHPISVSRQAEEHYPTMPLDAIKALSVAQVATDDSVLLLWSPATILHEALEVMAAWGWTYKSNLIWDKNSIGPGYYVRNQHEHLLIGTRGKTLTPPEKSRPPSVIRELRGRHSEKPARFYDLIEAMWPGLPRLELFARIARPGWTALGHETSGGDIAAALRSA